MINIRVINMTLNGLHCSGNQATTEQQKKDQLKKTITNLIKTTALANLKTQLSTVEQKELDIWEQLLEDNKTDEWVEIFSTIQIENLCEWQEIKPTQTPGI